METRYNLCGRDRRFVWLSRRRALLIPSCLLSAWFGLFALLITLVAIRADELPAHKSVSDMSIEELMQVQVATVTTASKLPEKATVTPGTTIVIDARDIELRGYSTLKDVLRDLPGMETTETYFSEIGTNVPVRGIVGNNTIILLVNGMRVNPPGGEDLPIHTDISVREAEQIEVVYGPGSTLYGQDAISAVINIKTRQYTKNAADIGVDAGMYVSREGWAGGGASLGPSNKIKVSGYIQDDSSSLDRLDQDYPAFWKSYYDTAAARGEGVVPWRADRGLNAFGRIELGPDTSAQIWRRQSMRSSAEGYGTDLGYLDQARWGDISTVGEIKNILHLSSRTTLESAFTANEYKTDPENEYVPTLNATQWNLNDFKYAKGDSETLEETVHAQPRTNVSLLAGVVAGTYDIYPKSTVPAGANPSDAGDFVYYTVAGDPSSIHYIPRVVHESYQTYGAYVESGWQATDRFKLVAGARLDRDTRLDETPFLPRIAAMYDVARDVKIKYTYTRAYIAPAAYFGYATYDNGSLLATSNANLKPETAQSDEVNVSWTHRKANVGLSLYEGTQQNLIQVSDAGLPQNIILQTVYLDVAGKEARTLVHGVNDGNSRNKGLDLYGKLDFGRLNLWFSYSYVDFAENTGGAESGLQGISRDNYRIGGTYAINPRLFVTPSLVLRSTPENVDAGALGADLTNPYTVNLHIAYSASKRLSAFFDATNLTDHKYALDGVAGQAIPQEPLRLTVGLHETL
ncbi:MAG: TonB-dependent receptor [Capsulimonadaceae bacterium]|nr:TonB-dependent receptor [Capsulimonadaceae bacterium]